MKSKLEYNYDFEHDFIDIAIDESVNYKKSIEISKGIILDLNEQDFPAVIEIISASKILQMDKEDLISPDIKITIAVSDELICIEIKFPYFASKKEQDYFIRENLANNYGIPAMKTVLSTG